MHIYTSGKSCNECYDTIKAFVTVSYISELSLQASHSAH